MNISHHHRSRKFRGGFSLIEVTIALGITAVAMVSLMGMLPKGMQSLRRAADQAIEGRIHQQILGELQLTPWEKGNNSGSGEAASDSPIDVFHHQVRFYDDQGIELPESEKGEDAHVYTARIHVPTNTVLPISVGGNAHSSVMQPLGGGGNEVNYLRLVIVEITSIVDPRFLSNPGRGFDSREFQKHIRTFQTVIAKMGQEFEPNPGES